MRLARHTLVMLLGFDTCHREPGTWKVKVSWSLPGSEDRAAVPVEAEEGAGPAEKRARRDVPCFSFSS